MLKVLTYVFHVFFLISSFTFIETYSQKIDSLKPGQRRDFLLNRTDSLKGIIEQNLDSASALKHYGISNRSAINQQQKLNAYSAKINILKSKLRLRIDSLSVLSIQDSSVSSNLLQIKIKLDSINRLDQPKTVTQASERVETFEQKLSARIDSIENKINKKLGLFSKNGSNMPRSVNLPGADLNTSLNIDSKPNIDPNLTAPNINLPGVENPLKGIDMTNIDLNKNSSGKLPDIPNVDVKEVKAVQDIGNVQDKLAGINEAGDQIKGYQDDLKNLQEGDFAKIQELPDAIESKVENLDEIKSLEEASEQFAAIKARWNDPEVLREQALNKAKESAVNHFAGHEKELQAAMDKLSRLKAKIPDPEGAIDLFAKRQQFMKGKPVVERFLPGFAFQFQKQNSFWLDLNPYVGFKISGRWLAGLGWNERVAYLFDERIWDKENWMYGPRSFLHFKLKANFWLKAEAENMNAPVRATPLITSEIVDRAWIWNYFAGIKKDFQFSKGLKANVQTLYNIYNPDKRSPYTNRLNIRIGFEFPLRKKRPADNDKE